MAVNVDLHGPWRAVVRAPMVRLAVPFIVGVAMASIAQPSVILALGVFVLLTPIAVFYIYHDTSHEGRWTRGLALTIYFFWAGLAWQIFNDDHSHDDHVAYHSDTEGPWLVRLAVINGTSQRSLRADALVEARWRDGAFQPCRGKVMLTLMRDTTAVPPVIGDRLVVDAALTPIIRIPDPGGFDRRRWAASRGIALEAFAPLEDWRVVGHVGHLSSPFAGARKAVSEWLDGSALPQRERALVKALVLGQRDELDGEQRNAFARSGTIHVLAVSGMHVGLIFTILTFLFGWMGGGTSARWIRGSLVLLALWSYAGLTGGSPSVLRATIMFSLFTVANMGRQRTDHLNSLFAAGLLLLIWDPDMLWQIGFQLSFLAVLGIILFYKPVERLWSPKSRILRGIWSLAVVSISAQLLTTPISLYLFKAFPVWFLPANIIVVTAVGLAVNGSVLLVLLYKVPWIGDTITWALTMLLKGVGIITGFFAELPGAYPELRIAPWDVLWLYLLILSMAAWWQWKWLSMRWVFGTVACVFLVGWGLRAERALDRRTLVVYDSSRDTQAAMVHGRSWVLLADSAAFQDDPYLERKVLAHQRTQGLEPPQKLTLQALQGAALEQSGNTFAGRGRWRAKGFDVMFLSGTEALPDSGLIAPLDAIIVHDVKFLPTDLLDRIATNTKHIVLGAGLSWRVRNMITEHAAKSAVIVHDIKRQGAFILER
jgi:competence protein ComEC